MEGGEGKDLAVCVEGGGGEIQMEALAGIEKGKET